MCIRDSLKVVTENVRDIANPRGTTQTPIGSHTLVGYCTMDNLAGFKLDPPRGHKFRVALALFSSADENEGFQIHKIENIEPGQIENAVKCMQRLRTLTKCLRSDSTDKRTRSIELVASDDLSPEKVKQARVLQAVPTDESLADEPVKAPPRPSSLQALSLIHI